MTQQASILIVTYNSGAEIGACIESAQRAAGEILVIDNASTDTTVNTAAALGVRVIANPANRGFAAAVNQGVRATGAPFLLLLNPDAVLQTGLEPLIRRCAEPGVAAAGGQLISANGVPQIGFSVRHFPSPAALFLEALGINAAWPANPVNWHYRCLNQDLAQSAFVDQPAGAFLLFRRDAWEKVGGFDEGFFPIWFEDVDFCKRLRNSGWQVSYCPEAVARHSGAHSITALALGARTKYWYCSLLRYSNRHFHPAGRALTGLGVAFGALLRICAGGRKHRSLSMIRIYGAVIQLALRSMCTRRVLFGEVLS